VRVANIVSDRGHPQFKCIVSLFNVTGYQIATEDKEKLLGEHFAMQKMQTKREFKKDQMQSIEFAKQQMIEEVANESADLGVESDLEEQDGEG